MRVVVCIGSSCHIKGSRQVVDSLKELISSAKLEDKIELAGTFCMGQCRNGVSVSLDDEIYSVSPETVEDFFKNNVLAKI